MKNKIIKTLCVLMALSFAFFLFSCTKDNGNPSEEVKYEINRTSIRLEMLETFQLFVKNATDVQWSSNNEAIAVVDENGLVTGVSKGNATIKAKFSSGTCECVVTVMESNDLPYLVVESDEISLLQNGSYTINAKVYFRNELCEDAKITFEILDKTIASVDENGLVTGLKSGTTQLNISAKWKVFTDVLTLKKTININVKNGVSVEILSSVKDLYTTDINVYGKSFESKTQLDVLITNYGVELAKENISWSSSDESVATVDQNGLVQAVGVGNVTIKASYSKDGLTSASIPYEIEVTKPYIDLTSEYPILVDCWLDVEKTSIQKDLADVFDSEHTITAVRDENGQSVSYYNTDTFTFDKDKVTVGENVWEIENEDYIVKTGVFFATKILTTAEDLVKMQEYGKIALFETHTLGANSVDEYRYQGYFALGNDIVFGSDDYGAGKTYISNINM